MRSRVKSGFKPRQMPVCGEEKPNNDSTVGLPCGTFPSCREGGAQSRCWGALLPFTAHHFAPPRRTNMPLSTTQPCYPAGRGSHAVRVSNQRTVRIHELASKRLPLPRRERVGVRVKTCGVSSAANAPLSLCPARNCDAPLTGPIPARQSTSPVSACPMPQSKTSNTTPINCYATSP